MEGKAMLNPIISGYSDQNAESDEYQDINDNELVDYENDTFDKVDLVNQKVILKKASIVS